MTLIPFALAVLLASTLMFVVEPMFARMILPRLGGSPAVWNTCLVFFQTSLLLGYLYAHLLAKSMTIRRQAIVHAALVVLAATLLPVGVVRDSLPPVDRSPIPWLLVALTHGVGAPMLMLSATSPLLQHWFAQTTHPSARDPYHLYAASNIGSIVALLSYPVAIEPFFPLTSQSSTWTVGYLTFAVLLIACGTVAHRFSREAAAVHVAPFAPESIDWSQRIRWMVLAIVPSSLLLSVTTYLAMDVAAVPLLWTVPLALYLLSFVLAFARRQVIPRVVARRALPLTITPLILLMVTVPRLVAPFLFPLHLVVFFLCALTLHTALADSRPGPRLLTEFYLWIGLGGVVGGLFNTLIAPLVFTDVAEYPIGLVVACVLQQRVTGGVRPLTRNDVFFAALLGLIVLTATYALHLGVVQPPAFALLAVMFAFALFSASRRPFRFALAMAAMLLVSAFVPVSTGRVLFATRTFFGVLRVQQGESLERHALWHGSTVHGEQDLRADRRAEPLMYYHRFGPIGQVFTALHERLAGAHIGVVGLGTGALTAYATRDQRWTLFEIDPAVAAIARNPRLFTYLPSCGRPCHVVLGDARVSLSRTRDTPFRLLVLDAFSSDAIPIHLVTREAVALYLSRLSPDGVLAFHISNRYFDLEPVLASIASEQKLVAFVQYDKGSPNSAADGHSASQWLVMARQDESVGSVASDTRWRRATSRRGVGMWTDDYSNIVSVLKILN